MDNYSKSYGYEVDSSTSLSRSFAKLMRSVYIWMCAGLAMTGLTAMTVASHSEFAMTIFTHPLYVYALMIVEIGIVIWMTARINKMSFAAAGLSFAAFSILNGISMSCMFFLFTMSSIAQTFFITAGTFGAMAVVGFFIKKDLSGIGRILIMALWGLIIATFVNIFWTNSGMQMIINYAGVLIFVGLTAWDSQKIKVMLQEASQYGVTDETQKLALIGALSLYLDFINLFVYLMRFFGDRK